MMEGLEQRRLLAANPVLAPVTSLDTFDGSRHIGAVPASTYNEQENVGVTDENDSFQDAELVPLGNGIGQQHTIDLRGNAGIDPRAGFSFTTDVDVYRFDLNAGDILDIAVQGAINQFTVFKAPPLDAANPVLQPGEPRLWFGVDTNEGIIDEDGDQIVDDGELWDSAYPVNSPLQANPANNAQLAQVVPEDGTYFLELVSSNALGQYTVGLRTYRPVAESLPVGSSQVIFVDFDGGTFQRSLFNFLYDPPALNEPVGGIVRLPSLRDTLIDLGVEGIDQTAETDDEYEAFLRTIIDEFHTVFADIGLVGNNGNFALSGNPGEYGVTILNSLDHVDPGDRPDVTRILMSGAEADYGFAATIAESNDIGNFRLDEYGVVQMDTWFPVSGQYPVAQTTSILEAYAIFVARVGIHEASHLLGIRHTDGTNAVATQADEGGAQIVDDQTQGIGNDGIYGTADDEPYLFRNDRFSRLEGIFGQNYVVEALSWGLSTGSLSGGGAGGTLTGRAFDDLNGDGVFSVDQGLAGATVFLDVDGDGVQDPTEPSDVTDASGVYSLIAASGTYSIVAVPPSNFNATSPVTQVVSVGTGAANGPNFGFTQVNPDITGFKFEDVNNNGFYDPGIDPGIADGYIYADVDGDNTPDLGEPFAITAADGSYVLDLPILGRAYAIREATEPGFVSTVPASGEYLINFTGAPLGTSFNFGGRFSRDYGDAPDSYTTNRDTGALGGPSHGITTGLTIGAGTPDAEDGVAVASIDGLGDDVTGADDENGVSLLPSNPVSILGGQIEVDLVNTTGQTAYLQGWLDLDGNGTFEASEKIADNLILGTGTHLITVPAGGTEGDTFVRFRYSLTPSLDFAGPADTGEVEDHAIRIQATGAIAVDDTAEVPRNSIAFPIDVLANDFNSATYPLQITTQGTSATTGVVNIVNGNVPGQGFLQYTPPNGFVGTDTITYRVLGPDGQTADAVVNVLVLFETQQPIAIDDTFIVPSNQPSFPLNVLANDITSVQGGRTLVSATGGSAGGTVVVDQVNQTLRYTPAGGFNGTEQFFYTMTDSQGQQSSAEVTVVLNEADPNHKIDFKIEALQLDNDIPVQYFDHHFPGDIPDSP
ncbi:MAG: Ig-like domain-containing protein, partial [Planctomycetota bacterium]